MLVAVMAESVESLLTQCCSGDEELDSLRDAAGGKLDTDAAAQVIQWDDYENSLAQLCGKATLLKSTRARKEELAESVRQLAQVDSEAQQRVHALETMRRRLAIRQEHLRDAEAFAVKKAQERLAKGEQMAVSGNGLLESAKILKDARSRLQEAQKLLAGEIGYGRITLLRNALTARRRCMVAQAAALYPLVPCTSQQKCPSYAHQPGDSPDCIPMTISGLHVIPPVKKEAALFNDKREYENSATALGYVAHIVTLVARYLDIRFRYPIRFQASRSYMQDYSPAIEAPTARGGAVLLPAAHNALVEFPLFSDGQDPTRAAYAVFLLNKDLEQILNHLGASSVGPRHVLPNLHRILRTIFQDTQLLA